MRVRRDGEETRQRILVAATSVFGEKGYRDATHAEICRRADVNTAAINYHFGSKDALYRAAWEYTALQAETLYPFDGGVAPEASPEERLAGFVRAMLRRRGDKTRLGHFHSIRMMEMVNPTGLLDDAMVRWRTRAHQHSVAILRELLGPEVPQRELELCEMSVISQCLMARPDPHKQKRVPWALAAEDLDTVADHILRFALAGIQAVRARNRNRAAREAGAGK